MDFSARAAWVYESSDPDTDKAKRYGIWYIYIDPRSDNASAAVSKIKAAGLYPGAYFVPSWHPEMTAVQFADWISDVLNSLLPRVGTNEAPPAMLDLEVGSNVQFATDCITRYRSHQPNRPTSYTNAPFQGGYVPYSTLKKYAMPFYVQMYYGDMSPADEPRALLEAVRGFEGAGAEAADMVFPFYDGSRWTNDEWSGCQFTLERMP